MHVCVPSFVFTFAFSGAQACVHPDVGSPKTVNGPAAFDYLAKVFWSWRRVSTISPVFVIFYEKIPFGSQTCRRVGLLRSECWRC